MTGTGVSFNMRKQSCGWCNVCCHVYYVFIICISSSLTFLQGLLTSCLLRSSTPFFFSDTYVEVLPPYVNSLMGKQYGSIPQWKNDGTTVKKTNLAVHKVESLL